MEKTELLELLLAKFEQELEYKQRSVKRLEADIKNLQHDIIRFRKELEIARLQ